MREWSVFWNGFCVCMDVGILVFGGVGIGRCRLRWRVMLWIWCWV